MTVGVPDDATDDVGGPDEVSIDVGCPDVDTQTSGVGAGLLPDARIGGPNSSTCELGAVDDSVVTGAFNIIPLI